MTYTTLATDDPHETLHLAGDFLRGEPVLHNVLLTLLMARVDTAEAGRYWIVREGDAVVGVMLQSPPTFPATLSPLRGDCVRSIVETAAAEGINLPGITGEAASVARFAGEWTEVRKVGATPLHGLRIYEALPGTTTAPSRWQHTRPASPTYRACKPFTRRQNFAAEATPVDAWPALPASSSTAETAPSSTRTSPTQRRTPSTAASATRLRPKPCTTGSDNRTAEMSQRGVS